MGMKLHNVRFLWASDEINKNSNEYWSRVMDISAHRTINAMKKCVTITGKKESDSDLKMSHLLYACMQCADVFFLNVDICQMGVDQTKVNMAAREYCDSVKMNDKPSYIIV